MMSRLRLLGLLLAVALPAGSAVVAEPPARGAEVGVAIPHTLAVRDQDGQHREFKSLARERGLIVLFSRSLSW